MVQGCMFLGAFISLSVCLSMFTITAKVLCGSLRNVFMGRVLGKEDVVIDVRKDLEHSLDTK